MILYKRKSWLPGILIFPMFEHRIIRKPKINVVKHESNFPPKLFQDEAFLPLKTSLYHLLDGGGGFVKLPWCCIFNTQKNIVLNAVWRTRSEIRICTFCFLPPPKNKATSTTHIQSWLFILHYILVRIVMICIGWN